MINLTQKYTPDSFEKGPLWMLIPRFILACIYLYLGTIHLLDPIKFQRTLNLPTTEGILFNGFFNTIVGDEQLFTLIRIFAGSMEIIIRLALVFGFLLRFCGIISTILLSFIVISLIPSWFILVRHALPLVLSIPMIFYNSNRYAPAEKFVPQSLKKWHIK